MFPDLRRESAQRTVEIDFPGYAIGGLSVGEPRSMTYEMVDAAIRFLPARQAAIPDGRRYSGRDRPLCRSGRGHDGLCAADRAARHGLLFTSEGRLTIKNARFANDDGPLDPAVSVQGLRALFAGLSAAPLRLE